MNLSYHSISAFTLESLYTLEIPYCINFQFWSQGVDSSLERILNFGTLQFSSLFRQYYEPRSITPKFKMNKSSRRPSLGKRRSDGDGWGVERQKRAKTCHPSESTQPHPQPDLGEYLIEGNIPDNGNRTVSPPSSGTSSPESITGVSMTEHTSMSENFVRLLIHL